MPHILIVMECFVLSNRAVSAIETFVMLGDFVGGVQSVPALRTSHQEAIAAEVRGLNPQGPSAQFPNDV